MSTPFILILLAACHDKAGPAFSDSGAVLPPEDDTSSQANDDTGGSTLAWISLPAECVAPDTLSTHPLTLVGEDQHIQENFGEWFMELVDVEADIEHGLVYGAGQGGLMVFDVSDARNPMLVGGYPEQEQNIGRFYRVEIGDGVLYASHRDNGMTIFDTADPITPLMVDTVGPPGIEGMALVGNRLYVANIFGALHTMDVTDPTSPKFIDEIDGLGTAWDILVSGDYGYVSDGQLGVVVIDLSNPDAPALAATLDVGGGVQDIAISGDALYAAAGGVGIVVVDITTPDAPSITTTLEYAGSVQSVAVQDDVLWAVSQEDVIAVDVRSPLTPVPLGTKTTPEFAMHVGAGDGVAWVGDWSRLEAWQVDTSATVPDLEISVNLLMLDPESDERILTMHNVGAGAVSLLGAEVSDDRLTAAVSADSIPPGESASLRLTYTGGDDPLEATLCLASDDPDEPRQVIELHTGSGGNNDAIGNDAPGFVLQDLDGSSWSLSDQLGKPVVLAYFATW